MTNTAWLRMFEFGVSSLVFSAMCVVFAYLGTRRSIGHRGLLLHAALFGLVRCILNIFLMIATYYRDPATSPTVSAILGVSCFVGLSLAVRVLMALDDLLATLRITETADLERKDHEVDSVQTRLNIQHMAETTKQRSIDLVSAIAARSIHGG